MGNLTKVLPLMLLSTTCAFSSQTRDHQMTVDLNVVCEVVRANLEFINAELCDSEFNEHSSIDVRDVVDTLREALMVVIEVEEEKKLASLAADSAGDGSNKDTIVDDDVFAAELAELKQKLASLVADSAGDGSNEDTIVDDDDFAAKLAEMRAKVEYVKAKTIEVKARYIGVASTKSA